MSGSLVVCERATLLTEAAESMVRRRVGAILVLEETRLVGILTERDVLRAVATGYPADARAEQWMTSNPETVGPSEQLELAAVLMHHGGFRHLPVEEDGRLVGVLSLRDLLDSSGDSLPRGV